MALESKPLNKANAIESASFVVGFVRGLAKPTYKKIGEALASLEEELPGVGPDQADVSLGVMAQLPGLRIQTPQATRFVAKKDGTNEWFVQATGNVVQVQCHEYTSFQEVWKKASRYLACALGAIEENVPIAEIGFQVIDRFDYPASADWTDYDIAELFNPQSIYLTPNALRNGPLWHVFQGWFDDFEGNRILHQLNLTGTQASGTQQLQAFIDHRGALRGPSEGKTLELKPFLSQQDTGKTKLDALFEVLHKMNRGVIEDLLTPQKLELIGISKGK